MPGILRPENPRRAGISSHLPLNRVRKTRQQRIDDLEQAMKDTSNHELNIFVDWDKYDLSETIEEGQSSATNTGGPMRYCRCSPMICTGELCEDHAHYNGVPETPNQKEDEKNCLQYITKNGEEVKLYHYAVLIRPFSMDLNETYRWCPYVWETYEETGSIKPCDIFLKFPPRPWVRFNPESAESPHCPRVTLHDTLASQTCYPCAIRRDPNSIYAIGPDNQCWPKSNFPADWECMGDPERIIHRPKLHKTGPLEGLIEEPSVNNNGKEEEFYWSDQPPQNRPPNIEAAMAYRQFVIIDDNWDLLPPVAEGRPAEDTRSAWLSEHGLEAQ